MEPEFLYRIEDDLLYSAGQMRLKVRMFRVTKVTPKGVWITGEDYRYSQYGTKERFVLNSAKKRYAYTTVDEALASYRIRKERHIHHLESRLLVARAGLKYAESPDCKPDTTFFDETLLIFQEY